LSYERITNLVGASVDKILLFWKSRESMFPVLSKLAKKYLACPATSAPTERRFSEAGRLYTQRRSQLDPENASNQLFIRGLYPILFPNAADKIK
jgi:hypothetical protein